MTNSLGLFEVVRNKIRVKHYSIRTEKTYVYWIKAYLQFYSLQHPRELGAGQIDPASTFEALGFKAYVFPHFILLLVGQPLSLG